MTDLLTAQELTATLGSRNPMVRRLGRNADTTLTCATCCHLRVHRYMRTYYKCAIRGDSACAATDHRRSWEACAMHNKPITDANGRLEGME